MTCNRHIWKDHKSRGYKGLFHGHFDENGYYGFAENVEGPWTFRDEPAYETLSHRYFVNSRTSDRGHGQRNGYPPAPPLGVRQQATSCMLTNVRSQF